MADSNAIENYVQRTLKKFGKTGINPPSDSTIGESEQVSYGAAPLNVGVTEQPYVPLKEIPTPILPTVQIKPLEFSELSVPQNLKFVAEETVLGADGTVLSNVVIRCDDVPNAAEYEFRITRND